MQKNFKIRILDLSDRIASLLGKVSSNAELAYVNLRFDGVMDQINMCSESVKYFEERIKEKRKRIAKLAGEKRRNSIRSTKKKYKNDKAKILELVDYYQSEIEKTEAEIESLKRRANEVIQMSDSLSVEIMHLNEKRFVLLARMVDRKAKISLEKTNFEASSAGRSMSRFERSVEKKEEEALKKSPTKAMKEHTNKELKELSQEVKGEINQQLEGVEEVYSTFQEREKEILAQVKSAELHLEGWHERRRLAKEQGNSEIEKLCSDWCEQREKELEELREVLDGIKNGMQEVEELKEEIQSNISEIKEEEGKLAAE